MTTIKHSDIPERARKMIEHTIEMEGGDTVTDHSDDRGGVTKYGISSRSYPDLDVRELSKRDAVEIYWQDYFTHKRVSADKIDDDPIAWKLFDTSVNMGVVWGPKIFQKTVNTFLESETLRTDGWVGSGTLQAYETVLEKYSQTGLYSWMCQYDFSDEFVHRFIYYQCFRYADIVANNSSQSIFIRGWINRAFERLDK